MSEDLQKFARKFTGLFHEKSESKDKSLIYSELKELNKRYYFIEEVASGGMKQIKKVLDQSVSRNIALAELLPEIDESFFELFLREARLTAMLEHPNIISVHDMGLNEEGRPFFTMDLKEGDSLQAIITQLKLGNPKYQKLYSRHDLLQIFLKICDAIAFAHSKNIIHLDLKPDNIQVGDFGEVLVCDWGLAKILHAQESADFEELLLNTDMLNHLTQRNKIVGTPGFMSPEQIDAKEELDQRTDVFSLACLLYSMMTYKCPFTGGSLEMIFEKTKTNQYIAPEKLLNGHFPKSLSAVISRSLQADKNLRYQSINELKNEVQNYLSGFSTEAENAGVVKELGLLIKRNKAASLTAIMAIIIIFGLSFYFIGALKDQVKLAKAETIKAEQSAIHLEKEKNKADQLLNESQTLLKRLTENFLSESELNSKTFIYEYPIKSLNKTLANAREILKIDPNNSAARHHLILSLFLMQNFQEIDTLPYEENKGLRELSNKYLYSPRKPIGLLSIEALSKLISDLKGKVKYDYTIALRLLAYDSKVRGDLNYYDSAVTELLKMVNLNWDGSGFEYNFRDQSLILNSKQIYYLKSPEFFASGKNPLSYLNLNSLTISGTSINDIAEFEGLKISTLDISQSEITQVDKIYKVKSLKKLIVHQGQLPQKQINNLRKSINIQIK
ncbi:serine/threonine-protein kinase [Lentisphaera profundi]|uniref:Serine/threonine-protein kinase n=1 Tax=Lentisphaera profundi TaxID=1658616 RepID=A0ABY7VS08_9BACT|nr:serine/threonine-protein kinase [Lentisphaera profundi]WDE96676.1 serine/threonine-protein kinase [Lentisphaera profundi]